MTSIGILSPPLIDVPIVVHVRSGGRPFAAGDWVGLFMLDAAGQAASTSLAVTPPRPFVQEGRVIQDADVPVGPATLVGSVSRDLSATAHPREGSVMADPAAGLLATGAAAPPSADLRAPASAAVVALTPAASPSASRAGSTTTSPPPPRAPAAVAVASEGVEVEEEERDRSPGMANASQSEDSTSRRRHRDGSALVAAVSPPPASTRGGSDRHPSWAVEEAVAGEERRGSGEPRVRQFSSGRPIAWQMLPTGYTAATCSFVLDPRLLDVHRDAATGAIAPVRLALRLVRQAGDARRAPSPSATTTPGGMHDSQAVDAECTVQLVSPLHAAQVCLRPGFTLDVHFAFTRDDTVIAWHGGATPGTGTPMLHHQHDFSLVHEGSGIEVARGPVVVGCGVLHMPMPRLAGRYLVLLRDPRHQIDLLRYPVEVVTGHDFRLVLAPGAGAIQPTASPIALEIISDLDGGRGRIHGAGVDASAPRTESSPTARAAHRARVSAVSPSQDAAGASAAASPPPRQPRSDLVDVESGLSGDADAEPAPAEAVESSAFHIEAFTPFDVRVVASHAGSVKHGDELLILRHHGGEVWDPISAPTARFPLARQDGTWRGIILPPGRFGVALGLRHERAVLIGATHWVVVSDVPPPPQPQPQPQHLEVEQQQHYTPQPHADGYHHHMHHGGGGMHIMQDHLAMGPATAHLHNHPHPAVYLTHGVNGVQWQQTPMTLGAIATHEFGYFPVPADMAFRGPHMAQPYMGGAGETRLGSGHAAGPIPAFVPTRTAGAGGAAPTAAIPPTARPWGPLPPPRPAAQYPPFIAELLGTTGAGAAPVAESANGAEGQAADAAHSMTALAPHHASPVPIDPSARPALRTVDSQVHADGSQTVTTTTYSSSLCMCCYERQMCVMLRPCRHVCLCEDCELQLRGTSDACPICRTTIQASERVFLP